jgi:hypothetical protein
MLCHPLPLKYCDFLVHAIGDSVVVDDVPQSMPRTMLVFSTSFVPLVKSGHCLSFLRLADQQCKSLIVMIFEPGHYSFYITDVTLSSQS